MSETPVDNRLLEALAATARDPLAFVALAFPWGEPGPLETFVTADGRPLLASWQLEVLKAVRDGLMQPDQAIRVAVASGHGVGKSALASMLILWAFSTRPDTRGVITANTETQLKTKTWAELARWFNMFIARDLFEMTKTGLFPRDPERQATWRIDMVPWSAERPEAFAGLHNRGNRILVIFDEASAIDDAIWETTEGALTDRDTEIIWCVFGNPSRPEGYFKDCFPGGRFAHLWHSLRVDSRNVPWTNKEHLQALIDTYGPDSDLVRVRVLGKFPRESGDVFIPIELAREAARRETPQVPAGTPLILGVDVARQGDDFTVLWARRGRDARTIPPLVLKTPSVMDAVQAVLEFAQRYRPGSIAVDAVGVGAGVADRLRQLNMPVVDVNFGTKAHEAPGQYASRRAELWGKMREWLREGGVIPDRVPGLEWTPADDMALPLYHVADSGRLGIELEPKRRIKHRTGRSPDLADALACTFALPEAYVELGQAQLQNAMDTHSVPSALQFNPLRHRGRRRWI